MELGQTVVVTIEVPRGSLIKWGSDGEVDFISPVPAPFNYGSVPGSTSADGEAADAVVLGPRLPRHHRGTWRIVGVVRFLDNGVRDDKLICSHTAMRAWDRLALRLFFTAYAALKRTAGVLTGRGESAYQGLVG